MTEGRCLCGSVRYEVAGPFTTMVHCHCSMCRKHHGTPYVTWAVAPLEGYRLHSGEELIEAYESSPGHRRAFCRRCGSRMPALMPGLGLVACPAGNLEGDLGIAPQLHTFTASKAPWYVIEDDLPRFEEYPPGFGTAAIPRAAPAAPAGVICGSCLCAGTAYQITGPAQRMYYCHCSRCRLGRSAAHAANVFYRLADFAWSRGEELIRDFGLPGAQFFGTSFCAHCGSAMPRVSRERGIVNVPAGSLDTDPGIAPLAHIFVASKAPWDTIGSSIPQFAEMPPGQ